MRVKRLVVIVLFNSSWAAAVVVDRFYGTCVPLGDVFGHGIQPTPLAAWNVIPIAVCPIAIGVVVWAAVGWWFQAKTFFSMYFVVILIFVSHPPPIAHSIPAGHVPGTCQDRPIQAFLSHDWDYFECASGICCHSQYRLRFTWSTIGMYENNSETVTE